MDFIDEIVLRLMPIGTNSATVIVCLFTWKCAAVRLRAHVSVPGTRTGMPFESTFADAFAEATRLDPAVHHGAVMVGRDSASGPYIAGWSFRLFPQAEGVEGLPNRGSAFNSAQTMSCVPTVDAAYWVSERRIYSSSAAKASNYPLKDYPVECRPGHIRPDNTIVLGRPGSCGNSAGSSAIGVALREARERSAYCPTA